MLNPFHGMVNIVEIPGADAVTRDGVNWSLYIQGASESETLADGAVVSVSLPDIKFGTWSHRHGLRRAPVRYVTDYQQLDAIGSLLLEQVKQGENQLPFPQADCHELWLLHAEDGLPLALLHSVCDAADATQDGVREWNPGQLARRSFRPDPLHSGLTDSTAAADGLARLINSAAGANPKAEWFLRCQDGHRDRLASPGQSGASSMDSEHFPELLLSEHWRNPEHQALVTAYLNWQAPWLLTLQTLSAATRSRLEKVARQQAAMMDALYPLYPEVLDTDLLKSARVEARLRRTAEESGIGEDEASGSFFVTGN